MFIKSKYLGLKGDDNECYINTDFLVDVFTDKKKPDRLIGYTLDDECKGYEIERADFENFLESERLIIESGYCVENA